MSALCKLNINRDCGGCMDCEPLELLGECEECSEEVYIDDDCYDFDGILVHADCVSDYIAHFRRTAS